MAVKVSVIIPVYNTLSYLEGCLNSVTTQTYDNLEIILVDDGSTDGSLEFLKEYQAKDSRIKIVENGENLGLFHTRIAGVEKATGAYLCFVDSDDEISCDYIRALLSVAKENHADIVMGNTINVNDEHETYYNNAISVTRFATPLKGEKVISTLFEQAGAFYGWHTIWNKLYKKEVWQKALPYLKRQTEKILMTEDFAFSTVLFYFAKSLYFAPIDGYFYYQRKVGATQISKKADKIENSINDIVKVFDFLREFLSLVNGGEKYVDALDEIRDKYYRTWCSIISEKLPNDLEIQGKIKVAFNKRTIQKFKDYDQYFYQINSRWDSRYADIKKAIASPDFEVISFDVFDTLLLRPFRIPSDLFIVLGERVKDITGVSSESFKAMRRSAERMARKKRANREEITFKDVYKQFGRMFNISQADCDTIMKEELECEKRYCYQRKSGKELLDLAKALNKKVVLVSDMYLSKQTVSELLHAQGITGYDKIFMSADEGVVKGTGNLYRRVCKNLRVEPQKVLHIGDNPVADVTCAEKVGLNARLLPKTLDVIEKQLAPIGLDSKDFTVRSLIGIVANKFYDKPGYAINPQSDFNGDSYFIGYYNIGLAMLGTAYWLKDRANKQGINKITFVGERELLVKKVVDYLIENDAEFAGLTTQSIYTPEKPLICYCMNAEKDFYTLSEHVDLLKHSPKSICELFEGVLSAPNKLKINSFTRDDDKGLDARFTSQEEFYEFIALLLKSYDKNYYNGKVKKVKEYFKPAVKGSLVFSLTQNPVLENFIKSLSVKCSTAYFTDKTGRSEKVYMPASKNTNYDVVKFLLTVPTNDGLYEQKFAINTMQEGCMQFIADFCDIFSSDHKAFDFSTIETTTALSYYLTYCKEFDRYMFNIVSISGDGLRDLGEKSFLKLYSSQSGKHKNYDMVVATADRPMQVNSLIPEKYAFLEKKNAFSRGMFYFFFDNKLFRKKLKNRLFKKKRR